MGFMEGIYLTIYFLIYFLNVSYSTMLCALSWLVLSSYNLFYISLFFMCYFSSYSSIFYLSIYLRCIYSWSCLILNLEFEIYSSCFKQLFFSRSIFFFSEARSIRLSASYFSLARLTFYLIVLWFFSSILFDSLNLPSILLNYSQFLPVVIGFSWGSIVPT